MACGEHTLSIPLAVTARLKAERPERGESGLSAWVVRRSGFTRRTELSGALVSDFEGRAGGVMTSYELRSRAAASEVVFCSDEGLMW